MGAAQDHRICTGKPKARGDPSNGVARGPSGSDEDGVQRGAVILGLTAACALACAGSALGRGGRYAFDGGTAKQQAQVRVALDVSLFNWSVVPATITIHLRRGVDTYATRGEIWIDTALLGSGTFAWGPIQHEYAHQVDFFLLDDAQRAKLTTLLGARLWSHSNVAALHGPDHALLGAERFASTLSWAYWPSAANSLRPASRKDESAAMAPARFRELLSRMLGIPNPLPAVVRVD
jgi:hypothetical protein